VSHSVTFYYNKRSGKPVACPSCHSHSPIQMPFGVVRDGKVQLTAKTFRDMLRGRVLIGPKKQGARCGACGRIFITSVNVIPHKVTR